MKKREHLFFPAFSVAFARTFTAVLCLLTLTAVILLTGCTEPADSTQASSGTLSSSVSTQEEPDVTLPVGNPSSLFAQSDKSSTLPVINIFTDSGEEIVSKDEYIRAGISVSGTAYDDLYAFDEKGADVRCRGNYTYTGMEKKSYRIKFDEKINLFGQGRGEAKSWVLLANHCDQTFLRNHAAFAIAHLLDNIPYCSSSSYVKLYINGEYRGIYEVAEQHQVHEARVDIDEDPSVIDTDYLIERDSYAGDEGTYGVDYFIVNRVPYLVKSDYMTEEKCAFLSDFIEKAHEAIRLGVKEEIEEYIDLPSFIDTFILQATMKNTDVGYSSFFMVKKAGGQLYFTCPWDFDLALGNDGRLDAGRPDGLYVGKKSNMDQEHEWFYLMMNHRWFCDMLRQRWNEVKEDIFGVKDELRRIYDCFADEMETNFEVWDIFGKRINQEPIQIIRLSSYKEHFDYLVSWFEKRCDYLDSIFDSDKIYEQGGEEDSGGWWW